MVSRTTKFRTKGHSLPPGSSGRSVGPLVRLRASCPGTICSPMAKQCEPIRPWRTLEVHHRKPPCRVEFLLTHHRVCPQLPGVSGLWGVTIHGITGVPTPALRPPGRGGCGSLRAGPHPPLQVHLETGACSTPMFLSPGSGAGEPAPNPCPSVLPQTESLAVLQGPPPPPLLPLHGSLHRASWVPSRWIEW